MMMVIYLFGDTLGRAFLLLARYVPNVAKEERSERGEYEISVRSMNIDDRRPTNDRPTSGPIHTFWENFKWP